MRRGDLPYAILTQPEICKVVKFLADKGETLDPMDANGRAPIIISDVLPIDMATEKTTGETPVPPFSVCPTA
jgi:hypothetical protein